MMSERTTYITLVSLYDITSFQEQITQNEISLMTLAVI